MMFFFSRHLGACRSAKRAGLTAPAGATLVETLPMGQPLAPAPRIRHGPLGISVVVSLLHFCCNTVPSAFTVGVLRENDPARAPVLPALLRAARHASRQRLATAARVSTNGSACVQAYVYRW